MAKEKEIEVRCPFCHGKGFVEEDNLVSEGSRAIVKCHNCAASFSVLVGDRRIKGRVEGDDAEEVSMVVRDIMNSNNMPSVNINISQSTIGLLNTGKIEDVESISLNITNLRNAGYKEVAEALKTLTEAVAESRELPSEARSEVLDQLNEI